jgi:hypothetical protein
LAPRIEKQNPAYFLEMLEQQPTDWQTGSLNPLWHPTELEQ